MSRQHDKKRRCAVSKEHLLATLGEIKHFLVATLNHAPCVVHVCFELSSTRRNASEYVVVGAFRKPFQVVSESREVSGRKALPELTSERSHF